MITLSRTRVFKRFALSLLGVVAIAVGVFFAAKNIKLSQVDAAASNATVTYGNEIPYDNWRTRDFKVTHGGVEFYAYCAQPNKSVPGSGSGASYPATVLVPSGAAASTYNPIKLLLYLANTAAKGDAKSIAFMNGTAPELGGNYQMFSGLGSYSDDSSRALRYAYVHAAIGYMYNDGDSSGLATSTLNRITNDIMPALNKMVNENWDVWKVAKYYVLYKLNTGSGLQDMVWLEQGSPSYGSIKVRKCDSDTQPCDATHANPPQGGASLQGIAFKLYNASGSRIYDPYRKQFYNDGAEIATAITDSNGFAVFHNLLVGTQYRVTETTTNTSYLMSATPSQTKTVTSGEDWLYFKDDVVRGDLKFIKKDKFTDEPMANVAFRIESNTTHEKHIIVSDENGEVNTSTVAHTLNTNGYDNLSLDTITYSDQIGTWFYGVASGGTGEAPDNSRGALPYDTYTITELECNANKLCHDANKSKKVSITKNDVVRDLGEWNNYCADLSLSTTAADKADDDMFIEAGKDVTVVDKVEYCLKAGETYTLKGVLMNKATGKPLLVDGKTVENSATITPTEDCGSTEMEFTFNSSDLAGTGVVVFESLYLGDDPIVTHEDIDDEGQTVYVISMSTTATDNADGDKTLAAKSYVEVKDSVDYCLKAGLEYTLKGVLMNKSTNSPLIVNDTQVEQTVTFTPEEDCGTVVMFFGFNTTGLSDTQLVVFEDLYYNDELILAHEDIDDEGQTITVAPDPPETGHLTTAIVGSATSDGGAIDGKIIIAATVVVIFGGYFCIRLHSKRKFYGRRR